MDSKKASQMKPNMDLNSSKSLDVKNDINSSFAPINSAAPSSTSTLKQCAAGLYGLKKTELNLKDLAKVQAQPSLRTQMFKELLENSNPKRLGIIAKCWLGDHDVHLLDESNDIMSHFRPTDPLPPGFEKARQLVLSMPDKFVALVVYTNRIEAVMLNGATVDYE